MSTITDTIIKDTLQYDELAHMWPELRTSGHLFDITDFVHQNFDQIPYKVGIANGLMKWVAPYAEDSVRGETIEQRQLSLVSAALQANKLNPKTYLEFKFPIQTCVYRVKKSESPDREVDVWTYPNGAWKTRMITAYQGLLPDPDDSNYPAVVFGFKGIE